MVEVIQDNGGPVVNHPGSPALAEEPLDDPIEDGVVDPRFDTDELMGLDPETAAALEELLRRKLLLEQLQAQRMADTMARELRQARTVNGIGALQRRIPTAAYHLWGQDLGYDCWDDGGFLKYFDRIAPEARVDARPAQLTIVKPEAAKIIRVRTKPGAAPRNVRFTKRYDF